jgi:ElaB/YqjD/DUF883 family membrane-anchored ribosome-binding protein
MTASDRNMSDTLTDNPTDQQRREIEDTRADMGRTLERIEDRVSPTRIKERQTNRLRARWDRTKDRVMGSDPHEDGLTDRMSDATDRASHAVQDAPERVENATRGNPIAAGLIAAGVGALIGSMIPPSKPERELGGRLRDEFEEPVRSELQHAGEEMREEMQEEAQHSVEEVKATAQASVERTRDEAEDSAHRIKDESKETAQDLRSESNDPDPRPTPPPHGTSSAGTQQPTTPRRSPTMPPSSTPPPPPR